MSKSSKLSTRTEVLFISDLHLDPGQPEITRNLLSFLQTRAVEARVLYILGDLFEVWLGDDDDAAEYQPVMNVLKELSQSVEIYFIHGNRDFLIGADCAERCGMTLIDEPILIELGTLRVGLMHGDLLCSDDVDYQNFRCLVRSSEWQQQFLGQSIEKRREIAAGLRDRSSEAMQAKDAMIMDVNQDTVNHYFDEYQLDVLIHGHTHRPGRHAVANNRLRLVLGDWRPQPSYIRWDQNGFTLTDPRIN